MKKVYAAVADDGLVKVGSSVDPGTRVQHMRSRGKLSILFQSGPREDGRRVELVAHRLLALAGRHVAGEWFNASIDEVEDAVARAERILDGEEFPLMHFGVMAPAYGEFVATPSPPCRGGKVSLTVWTSDERRRNLKRLAVETGKSITEIIEAMIDKEFAKVMGKR